MAFGTALDANLYQKGEGIYNAGHSNFGSDSDTDVSRIQAAIDAAKADGVPIVLVPDSLLPYDASSVTFDNSVRMVREGQQADVFDVKAYGAAGDGTTIEDAALRAVHEAAVVNGETVYYPDGDYNVDANGVTHVVSISSGEAFVVRASEQATIHLDDGWNGLHLWNVAGLSVVDIQDINVDGNLATLGAGAAGSVLSDNDADVWIEGTTVTNWPGSSVTWFISASTNTEFAYFGRNLVRDVGTSGTRCDAFFSGADITLAEGNRCFEYTDVAFACDNAETAIVRNNWIQSSDASGAVNTAAGDPRLIAVLNNRIDLAGSSSGNIDLQPNSAELIVVDGNIVNEPGEIGILAQGDVVYITSNKVLNGASRGIAAHDFGVVSHNHVEGCQENGIHAFGPDEAVISFNTCIDNGQDTSLGDADRSGIYVEAPTGTSNTRCRLIANQCFDGGAATQGVGIYARDVGSFAHLAMLANDCFGNENFQIIAPGFATAGVHYAANDPTQRSISKLTNNLADTTTDGTLEDIGDTSAGDVSPSIERNLSELNAKIESLIDAMA